MEVVEREEARVGAEMGITHTITLNGNAVEWTDHWEYLGVTHKSGKTFNCSIADRIKKFYRCTNCILRIDGRSNDTVMLRLIETHCIPLLTYAIEIVHVNDTDERRQIRYRMSQSVSSLQSFLGRCTWEQLIEKRKANFFLAFKPDMILWQKCY